MNQKICVYLLQGSRYYVGSTNDLDRRLQEHFRGEYSTKKIGCRKLVGYIPCESLKFARKLEKLIKKRGHYLDSMKRYGMIT